MSRVVLAMSGGVDSSVAAHLLLEAGHEVIGVFMRHGVEASTCAINSDSPLPVLGHSRPRADHKQGCCTASDAADARRVAELLGISFYALNLDDEFGRIVDYFVDEYTSGRTPNPCVMCNNWIKFGKLFDYADSVGASYVATGHYARLRKDPTGTSSICRGSDVHKDQSYVLFGIKRDNLSRMLLPVGDFHKRAIRELATRLNLRVADKRDSQEICFVPSGHHAEFVAARRGACDTTGEFVTTDGRVVGEHDGIERFTIGQRKGLGVALGEPYFVVRIEPETNRVILGKRDALACRSLMADDLNWLVDLPDQAFDCLAQIRYNSRAVPAKAELTDHNALRVDFDEPSFGVAPGQAIVCYDGDQVLGGGWIQSSLAAD